MSSQIHKETNERMYRRNVPSQNLQSYLDARPVMTKYSIMPIVDPRPKPSMSVPLHQEAVYSPETVFNPGNARAPWSGYASAINAESELRNQLYALQSCSQAVYVPNSTSDLYTTHINPQNQHLNGQQFNGLFKRERFDAFNPNPENIASGVFNNHTRHDIRGFGQ